MLPLTLWIVFMLFVNGAWAGGYAGALERLWLYYAYEIDGLKPVEEQTLGFACRKKNGRSGWDFNSKTCPIGGDDEIRWRSCGEVQKVTRCNFNQLMEFVGGVQKGQKFVGGGADQSTHTPPIQETAINLYNYMKKKMGKGGTPESRVGNYAPQNFLKGSNGEYNPLIETVGDRAVASGSHRSERPELFNGFAEAGEKIVEARRGDHGPYLIADAEKQSWAKSGDIEVKVEDVGTGQSPVNDGADGKPRQWQTVDFQKTLESSKLGGGETVSQIEDWLKTFYTTDDIARDHRQVIMGFDDLSERVRTC